MIRYVALFAAGEWLLSRVMPYDRSRAWRILSLSQSAPATIDSAKTTMAWASLAGYAALLLIIVALFAWEVTTRKSRTAR